MSAVGTASGKVILFGEHAVVYGVPAIAAGISRGAEARVVGAGGVLTIRGPRDAAPVVASGELARAFGVLGAAISPSALPSVHVDTTLPAGAGLGCSAALGVAIARALFAHFAIAPDDAKVIAAASVWENVFHGNASGIDATVAALGGCVRFVRGETPTPLQLRRPFQLAIGDTRQYASTKTMVEGLATLKSRSPVVVEQSFDAIRSLSGNAKLALEAGDLKAVGQLMDLNQMLLAGLFLSTTELEELIAIARANGALGAKLTGGGGGGCMVALCDGNGDAVVGAFKDAGYDGFVAEVSA